MKAILFDEKFGLRSAVLSGRKTMTRRLMKPQPTWVSADGKIYNDSKPPRYKVGEVVAVAQPYETFMSVHQLCERGLYTSAGAHNSMFIKPLLMPHKIRITDVKVEMLQDISDEDCFKEGIIPITWRQHLPQAIDDLSPQKHIDHNVYTLEKFRERIEDCWAESDPNEYMAEDAKTAFAVLIFKMYGRKVWEGNPYVFAYTFELIK